MGMLYAPLDAGQDEIHGPLEAAPRILKTLAAHRQDLLAERGPRGHPLSAGRPREGKDRHHCVKRRRRPHLWLSAH